MSFKNTKIFGTSILTILGVVCLATFMIAAFTWSTQTTASRGPIEVSLGTPSLNEWNTANFFEANKDYDITMTATYNYHNGAGLTYYLGIIATVGQGTMELNDFSISVSGVTTTFTETSPGVWTSSSIFVVSSNPDDVITFTITPTTDALDLTLVSFAISAQSSG